MTSIGSDKQNEGHNAWQVEWNINRRREANNLPIR